MCTTMDTYQIYDKLSQKGGLKELFEQRFSNALVFMKHLSKPWASIACVGIVGRESTVP